MGRKTPAVHAGKQRPNDQFRNEVKTAPFSEVIRIRGLFFEL